MSSISPETFLGLERSTLLAVQIHSLIGTSIVVELGGGTMIICPFEIIFTMSFSFNLKKQAQACGIVMARLFPTRSIFRVSSCGTVRSPYYSIITSVSI